MKRGVIVLLAALFFAVLWRAPAVIIHPSGGVYMPDVRFDFANAFTWAVMTAFAFYVASEINVWVGLFFVLASWSAYSPINTSQSEQSHHFVLYGIILYSLSVHYLNTPKAQRWTMNTMCCIAMVHLLLLFGQTVYNFDPLYVGLKPLYASTKFDPVPNVGLLSCVNDASIMLAIILPAFFRRGWIYLTPLFLFGFVATHSFVGPLAASVTSISYIATKYKIGWLKIAFVGILALLCLQLYVKYVDEPDLGWRWKAWKSALLAKDMVNPLTGVMNKKWKYTGIGIGHWKLVYSRKDVAVHTQGQFFAQAHNEPIQMQTEMGYGFPLILTGFLLSVIFRFRLKAILPTSALIAILITSNTFFVFHISFLAMVSILWMAMLQNTLKPSRSYLYLRSFFTRASSGPKQA